MIMDAGDGCDHDLDEGERIFPSRKRRKANHRTGAAHCREERKE